MSLRRPTPDDIPYIVLGVLLAGFLAAYLAHLALGVTDVLAPGDPLDSPH